MKFKFLGCFLVIDVQLQEYCCNCYPYNIYVITVNSASNLYMSVSSFPPIFCTFIDQDGNYNLSIHCPCLSCWISYVNLVEESWHLTMS